MREVRMVTEEGGIRGNVEIAMIEIKHCCGDSP